MGFKGKGSMKKARNGTIFKKGHLPLYRKSPGAGISENIKKTVKRSDKSLWDFINKKTSDGLVTHEVTSGNRTTLTRDLPLIDGERTDLHMLRPKKQKQTVKQVSNNDTNVILHRDKTCQMFNEAFMEHSKLKPLCKSSLTWDEERSTRWGLAWKTVVKCNTCDYRSNPYKLYTEVESSQPGPKVAAINMGIQIGLMKQGVSNTGMREILTSANIVTPCKDSMRKAANKVGSKVVQASEENLEKICSQIQN